MKSKALVLLSGGQDSTTCLAQALADFPGKVETISFDYGQRHSIELSCAKKIAALADVNLKTIKIDFFKTLTTSALTDKKLKIINKKNALPSTFVPGRNLLFLNLAAIYAYEQGIKNIYTGVCETDYSGYPDCRQEFIKSVNQTLNLAMLSDIKIITPLMHLSKAQSIKLMQKLGKTAWYKFTHTCYEGIRPACGVCPACILRLKGFSEAGLTDLIKYKTNRKDKN